MSSCLLTAVVIEQTRLDSLSCVVEGGDHAASVSRVGDVVSFSE